ncbi:peptidase S10, serine carboxypeptidase [Tothia fuscella]|uniref:Carboxypeptidase n=1 Tax=Tothia fuscella TaxID=1048955 RepID=A0A9P4NG59_9PEZI|nr:peptidase S10, serine carboxypeptidase [Tothia fuscella]
MTPNAIVTHDLRQKAGSLFEQPLQQSLNDAYTIVTHDAHPNHALRIRAHNALNSGDDIRSNAVSGHSYCEGATKGYTGYLTSGDKHFYFAYFESRTSPEDDPLLMWINGGPGCSSMMGLFMENGPCRVNEHGNETIANPYSWIETANIFFLDQPIGVGFSYDSGSLPGHSNGTFAASDDIYAFMRLWYLQFPKSQKKPFSIAGESYGGHYIPIFASHIVEQNELSIYEGRPEDVVPLESVMIGNGIFDPLHQATSGWDMTCTNVTGIGPVITEDGVCEEMASHIDRCEYLWTACYDYPDPLICRAANTYCGRNIDGPYFQTGLNYYDISKPCNGDLCYPEIDSITKYLNRQDVRDAFGVDKAVSRFDACSNSVGRDFNKVGDGNTPTTTFTTFLLNKGIKVLMYVGTYDWICNFVGNERFLLALPWIGDYGYRHAATYGQKQWEGGQWWEFENLRYIRVQGAGHMVPFDKPEVALSMVKSWLKGKPLK